MHSCGLGHLLDGHKPDRLDTHGTAYIEFVRRLYQIACDKLRTKPDWDMIEEFLRKVMQPTDFLSAAGSEALAIQRIKAQCRMGIRYGQQDNSVPWDEYFKTHQFLASFGLRNEIKQQALSLSAAWAWK